MRLASDGRTGGPSARLSRLAIGFALAVCAGIAAALSFAAPYVVAHESMFGTLRPGEVLLVDRLTPSIFQLHRGDIVVFRPPLAGHRNDLFVKRVIGVAGDTVDIANGTVLVNGERLAEPYLASGTRTDVAGGRLEVQVQPGELFVLGDNRAISWDSREYGGVPVRSVLGLAWLGYAPGSSPALLTGSAGHAATR